RPPLGVESEPLMQLRLARQARVVARGVEERRDRLTLLVIDAGAGASVRDARVRQAEYRNPGTALRLQRALDAPRDVARGQAHALVGRAVAAIDLLVAVDLAPFAHGPDAAGKRPAVAVVEGDPARPVRGRIKRRDHMGVPA